MKTLAAHAASADVPTYDRAALSPAVVHISVGSFHRAHQASYFDEIAQRGISTRWGVVGVGLRRRCMKEALAAQDGLYTVLTRGRHGDRARVIGVLGRYLYAPEDSGAVLAALAAHRTRLVTLTVTGCGYAVDPEAEIATELADHRRPTSAIAYLVEALARRRRAGHPPFTVLSCDNIPDNGARARAAVLAHAERRDPRLAYWIAEHAAFPSSMVDRITPRTTPEDIALLAQSFGIRDRWPVVTEPFSDWVIEDRFCHGRPPLDRVGARFVSDVAPYALTKTRLLNAAHCALGYLGSLAGYERTDQAMADPVLHDYVARLMDEVTPLLPSLPDVDLPRYTRTLLDRLANPRIGDQLGRLARGGSTKMPTHVLSSIVEARRAGRPHRLLTLAVAGWLRYLRGIDEGGRALVLDDPGGGRLQALAILGGSDLRPILAERGVFGPLAEDPGFGAELAAELRLLERSGARAAAGVHALARDPSLLDRSAA